MTQQPPLRELCQHSGNMSVPPDTGAATKMEREKKKRWVYAHKGTGLVLEAREEWREINKKVNTVWF